MKTLSSLKPYFWKYRWAYLFAALPLLIQNVAQGFIPHYLGMAADDINHGVNREKLLFYTTVILALSGTRAIFLFLTRWKVIGISRAIEFDLRNDLFRHLEGLAYPYYQRTRTGDIMARATNDLNAVRNLLGPGIMYSANTIVGTAVMLGFLLRISPRLTLYTYLPLPVASILIQYFGRKIHERFERIQAMFSDISSRVQENFSGIRIVKAFAQEEAQVTAFEADNQEYVNRSLPLARLMGMLWPALEFVLGIATVLVLWLGGREVLHGGITVGQFVAFTLYIIQLTWPIIALGWVINVFNRGTASLARINEIFAEKPEIIDALVSPEAPRNIEGDIEFRDLNFSYNGTRVLKDINLRIPAGSSLAIVGPTGSGKSTLVNLIPRIYDAEPGLVLLDGKPIREFPLAELRRNIGFVPQETFLFSDTIRENIAFGAEHATDSQIEMAAEGASIAVDIDSFPERYQTAVGERGITLSGGQKQRTAIARAIVRDPRILVLDDALSSVDTYTEEKILDHLREVMRGRTTVFISHRVSTVRNADRIAVLHGGSIVELGTHEELLERNGYYTDLYNKQLLEEELAQV